MSEKKIPGRKKTTTKFTLEWRYKLENGTYSKWRTTLLQAPLPAELGDQVEYLRATRHQFPSYEYRIRRDHTTTTTRTDFVT